MLGQQYKTLSRTLRHLQPLSRTLLSSRLNNVPALSRLASILSRDISITTVPMPSLSPTMEAGSISSWNKQPGDALAPGDILCEIETDKASVGFEIQDDGVLAKILIDADGSEITCGLPIALVVEDEEEYANFLALPPSEQVALAGSADTAPSIEAPPTDTPVPAPVATIAPPASNSKDAPSRRVSPAARHQIESQSLDISNIVGTGKGGLLTKEDVILGVKSGTVKSTGQARAVSPPPAKATATSTTTAATTTATSTPAHMPIIPASIGGAYEDIKNSNMRKVIAKRLSESKATVPHQYTTMECEIDALLALRKTLKSQFGVNVSVNDVVIKAAALALRDVPECNGKWAAKKEIAEMCDSVDISVAVATPSGLITPIVTNADKLGLVGINTTVKDLAGRARDGKLKPEEYQGGTFTISNLGMFGISSFSAVINPPQACILAVGGGIPKVLPPLTMGATGSEGQPRVSTTMTVQLSSDRRVVDEAIAAQYLQVFRYYLSNPQLILL